MKQRIVEAFDRLGYAVTVIGGRTLKITAVKGEAHIDVYIRHGFDSYQSWQHISGGKVIAHNYSHGDVVEYATNNCAEAKTKGTN